MGNGVALFGTYRVGTTGQLAQAVRAGVVGQVAIDGLRRGWFQEGIRDSALFSALEILDLFRGDARKLAKMESVVARLLEAQSRAGYWGSARGHMVGLVRFASAEVVTDALTDTLSSNPNFSSAYAGYAGAVASNSNRTLHLAGGNGGSRGGNGGATNWLSKAALAGAKATQFQSQSQYKFSANAYLEQADYLRKAKQWVEAVVACNRAQLQFRLAGSEEENRKKLMI